jgi:capsular polysaccharide biosynthesis protein
MIIALAAVLGLASGVVFTMLRPPLLTAKALIVLSTTRFIQTQVLIAESDPVLEQAMTSIHPAVSLTTLRNRVHVGTVTSNVLAVSAKGETAAQAENIANSVTAAYLSYVQNPGNPGGQVIGRILEKATSATGTLLRTRILTLALGALLGAVVGAITAVAIDTHDKRLRLRVEIADAIGVPVLAALPVRHPSDAAGWTKLLEGYEPQEVHAWTLRKALHHLGLTDFKGAGRAGTSLAVISLATDRGALALGPQLAVYAASLGIPTSLVIGPQQDPNAAATLRAACGATSATPSEHRSNTRISFGAYSDANELPAAALTVAVAVVDGIAPKVDHVMRTTATVLAVSAGAATAEQLARIAVSASTDGRDIAGILVADPDPTDLTTGRLGEPARPSHRRRPSRVPGSTIGGIR